MDRVEILIDNLLIYVPADMPFLASLIARPDGRYVFFGLAIVIALLVVWLLLALVQMIFIGQGRQPVTNKTPSGELSAKGDTNHEAETETADGFSFFKKAQDYEGGDLDDNPALVAIEQEMLAVRSLYTGGRIIKDVYVSETRRLYAKAQEVKNSQSQ